MFYERKSKGNTFYFSDQLANAKLLVYYKGDTEIPLYGQKGLELKEIVEICAGGTNKDLVCTKRPYRVFETSTFVVHQGEAKVAHPFDLDSDDSCLKFTKKENACRFYEIKHFGKDDMQVSHEVIVVKNRNGQVVSGTYRKRCGKQWVTVRANVSEMYVIIRRRAFHVTDRKSFVRYITFMMCMIDFNEAKQTMKEMKCYKLRLPYIIIQYSIQGDYSSETQTLLRAQHKVVAHWLCFIIINSTIFYIYKLT